MITLRSLVMLAQAVAAFYWFEEVKLWPWSFAMVLFFLIKSLFVIPCLTQSWLWEEHQANRTPSRRRGNPTWIPGTTHIIIALPDSLWSTTDITTQRLGLPAQAVRSDSLLQRRPGQMQGAQTAAGAPLQSRGLRDFHKAPLCRVSRLACSPMPLLASHRAPARWCSTCWDWTPRAHRLQLQHRPGQPATSLERSRKSRRNGAWLCPTWGRASGRVTARQQGRFLPSTTWPHRLRRSSPASSCDAATLARTSSCLSERREDCDACGQWDVIRSTVSDVRSSVQLPPHQADNPPRDSFQLLHTNLLNVDLLLIYINDTAVLHV